jgi:hypothetical protein
MRAAATPGASLPLRELTALRCLLQSLHMLLVPELYGLTRGTPDFEAATQELLAEARLLHSLHHPNIVLFHGVAMHPEHGHVQWLVTELADGGSLEAWVSARDRLTLEELLDLLRSVMRALVYLHSRAPGPAVIHRDVKPANVLVFTSLGGIVWKLGDVGIAKVLQSTQRARTGAGTALYAAPDVHLGPYDGKVDVFSTGIMAAELVVRYMDIAGFERSPPSKYRYPEHRPALVDDACARLDTVSPALSSVLRRCCAMMAADRMRSDVALRALNEIVVGGGGGGGSAAVPAPAAYVGGGAVPATSAVPAPAPSAGAVPLQLIDMSVAESTMGELGIEKEASDRVCDAMVLAADAHGLLPGAQLLQMVVDEGVRPAIAMRLRQRLGITAGVPPRRVRGDCVVMLLRCACDGVVVRDAAPALVSVCVSVRWSCQ